MAAKLFYFLVGSASVPDPRNPPLERGAVELGSCPSTNFARAAAARRYGAKSKCDPDAFELPQGANWRPLVLRIETVPKRCWVP